MTKILTLILINGLMATTAFAGKGFLDSRLSHTLCSTKFEGEETGFIIKRIGEGVYAAMGGDDDPAENNAGFIVGSNGVVVVDTFEDVAPARDLLTAIRKITNLPIRFVINTHYHLDHVGGNAVFAEAGATILAHRNVRSWERTENLKFFGADPRPEKRAYVEAFVLPDMVYTDSVDIYLGSRLIQVRYLLGHTGGDSVVIVPSGKDYTTDIVFAGDIIWQKHLPNLIDASTATWIETLDKLSTERGTAIFIPGHGNLATSDDVRDFRKYLETLRKEIAKAQSGGKSGPQLIEAVLPVLKDTYGKWGFFDYFVKRNIEHTAAELKGKKRILTLAKD